mmetsp:Transcript_21445/g.33556  ORF Transcript_21445/g.33556 Transcript_21445/m.33556 type:complete len:161 (-) Transcript_21445:925-1407(-)
MHTLTHEHKKSSKRHRSEDAQTGTLVDILAVLQSFVKRAEQDPQVCEAELFRGDPCEIPWNVMTIMRWKALKSSPEWADLGTKILEADEGSPLSIENERVAKEELGKAIGEALESLPTTVAQDSNILTSAAPHSHRWIAVAIRKGQKELLADLMESLDLG